MTKLVHDTMNRPLHDLRISVTDRCNFRCPYCMPKETFGQDYEFLKRQELLTFEEIERLVRILVNHGVRKVRLTGGEPLLRKSLEKLVTMLKQVPDLDLALTTNGALLASKATLLKNAGLNRVTVSLDSLDAETFALMSDVKLPVEKVLQGIETATNVGLTPIKINMVVKAGINEHSILPMAHYFKGTGNVVRFIEYMDVGQTNGWRLDEVVPASKIIGLIDSELPLEPVSPSYRGEVARRWKYKDGTGEIGIITSVNQPFCSDCTRIRLSADGQLYTCLFATKGHNLLELLRDGAGDTEVSETISSIWKNRTDRYSEIRSSETVNLPKIEMSYIGG